MMNEESLKAWEQDHIELLTSREMGEWLYRREMNARARANKERPHGKWRVYEGVITCEKCGKEAEEISPFCAWCGADMRDKEK